MALKTERLEAPGSVASNVHLLDRAPVTRRPAEKHTVRAEGAA
jgi:hypothetical protein